MDEEKILPLGAEITAVGVLQIAPDGTPVVKSSNHLPVFLYVLLKLTNPLFVGYPLCSKDSRNISFTRVLFHCMLCSFLTWFSQ